MTTAPTKEENALAQVLPGLKCGIYRDGELERVTGVADPRGSVIEKFNSEMADAGYEMRPLAHVVDLWSLPYRPDQFSVVIVDLAGKFAPSIEFASKSGRDARAWLKEWWKASTGYLAIVVDPDSAAAIAKAKGGGSC